MFLKASSTTERPRYASTVYDFCKIQEFFWKTSRGFVPCNLQFPSKETLGINDNNPTGFAPHNRCSNKCLSPRHSVNMAKLVVGCDRQVGTLIGQKCCNKIYTSDYQIFHDVIRNIAFVEDQGSFWCLASYFFISVNKLAQEQYTRDLLFSSVFP